MTNKDYKDLQSLMMQNQIALIYYVLKRITDENHALSSVQIATHLSQMFPHYKEEKEEPFSIRTLSRKMKLLELLDQNGDEFVDCLNNIYASIFGGRIKTREADGIYNGTNTRSCGSQKRYYFETLLTSSDMDLVYGSLRSNRYLSDAEKKYLLSRLELLHPSFDKSISTLNKLRNMGIVDIKSLPKRPVFQKEHVFPGQDSRFLKNTQIIYEAIENDWQIEMIYGMYDVSKEGFQIDFHARDTINSPSVLNPYALLWNEGEYYLIASCEPDETPYHYRVDRIMSVKIHCMKNENGILQEIKRRPKPKELVDYFEKDENDVVYFDAIRYANVHPKMAIHHVSRLTHCTFECTNRSLQVLVDNFGPKIKVIKSDIVHETYELDYKNRPQDFLLATIADVEYDNALRFAIMHCQYFTLISPKEMVEDLKNILMQAYDRL